MPDPSGGNCIGAGVFGLGRARKSVFNQFSNLENIVASLQEKSLSSNRAALSAMRAIA